MIGVVCGLASRHGNIRLGGVSSQRRSRFERATRSLATFVRSHCSLLSLAPLTPLTRSAALHFAHSLRSLPRGTVEILENVFTLLTRFTGRNAFFIFTRITPKEGFDEVRFRCSNWKGNEGRMTRPSRPKMRPL